MEVREHPEQVVSMEVQEHQGLMEVQEQVEHPEHPEHPVSMEVREHPEQVVLVFLYLD
jgi:hypothetical protein